MKAPTKEYDSTVLFDLVTNHKRGRVKISSRFLIAVCQNRLLYWFAKKYGSKRAKSPLKEICTLGEIKLRQMSKTVTLIEEVSRKQKLKYIIPKRDRTLPYINCDLDLLVKKKDYPRWINILQTEGFRVEPHKTFLKAQVLQNILRQNGHYKIDITTQFNWQDALYFDPKFLWDGYNSKTHRLSPEADFLVTLGNLIFKKMNVSLLDYIYLKKISKPKLDWQTIKKQVSKHHWQASYKETMKFFHSLDPEKQCFPALFPFHLYFKIFTEKIVNRCFSLNYFVYFILARARYHLLRRIYLPFHVFWYPLIKIKQVKNFMLRT